MSFLVLFFAVAFVSCEDGLSPNDEVSVNESPQESSAKEVPRVLLSQDEMILLEELSNKTPKRSMEQAMEIASNFFGKSSDAPTLSKRGAEVPRCEVLTRSKHTISKSGTTTEDIDTLMYLFNYDEGYAVVSADVRVPERVLAYSEEGNVSANTDNPGLQIFMDMAQDYVDLCVANAEAQRDSVEQSLTDKLLAVQGISQDTTVELSKSKVVTDRIFIGTASWDRATYLRTDVVGPYISARWHQENPYNKYAPEINGTKCLAGCVAIATAQLMAYWRKPAYSNKFPFNWSDIVNPSKPNHLDEVARFVRYVCNHIGTTYGINCSSAYPKDAISFLRRQNYSCNNLSRYYTYDITKSLDDRRPVLMTGCTSSNPSSNGKDGHTWIVDGYAKKHFSVEHQTTYLILYRDDADGKESSEFEVNTWTTTQSDCFFHINWGWGLEDLNDGYYATNVLDNNKAYQLNSNNELQNSTNIYRNHYFYKYYLYISTQIHPNK